MATIPELSAWVPVPAWDDATVADGSEMNLTPEALVQRDNFVLDAANAAQTTANTAVTNAATAQTAATTAQTAASAARQMTGRNLLMNCGLPINQRGFAGGALAANVYGYDRWKGGSGGCNVTINASTGVYTHTSGPLLQIVEAPDKAWGVPLTISVEDPSGTVSVSVGGASGSITAGSGRRGVTLTPSGSGNMNVQLTATGVTYSRPQLERGNVATAFDTRPYWDELARCSAYYEKSYDVATAPGTGTRLGAHLSGILNGFFVASGSVKFQYPKRGTPIIAVYAARSGASSAASEISTGGTFVADRTASASQQSQRAFMLGLANTGATGGNTVEVQWTADAEL